MRNNYQTLESPSAVSPPSSPLPSFVIPRGLQSSESLPPVSTLLQQIQSKNHIDKKVPSPSPEEAYQGVVYMRQNSLKARCGVDAWRRWTQWRESQVFLGSVFSNSVDLQAALLCCSAAELCDSLCLFVSEVKQSDGQPYSSDSLFYLCLSIQQYLFENGRMENIFSDLIYSKFSIQLTNVMKLSKPSSSACGYMPSCVEEKFLWDCKQLGAYSPYVLLNTLLFYFCKYFGSTTVEQHRQLSFSHIRFHTRSHSDSSEVNVLRVYAASAAEESHSDSNDMPPEKRRKMEDEEDFQEVMENTENPLRCPVRLTEFYLSKCPESVRNRSDVFYLLPDRSCVPSSPLWFLPSPLDHATMEAMVVRILAVREIQEEED